MRRGYGRHTLRRLQRRPIRPLRTLGNLILGLWYVVVVDYVRGAFPWAYLWWAILFGAGLLVGRLL